MNALTRSIIASALGGVLAFLITRELQKRGIVQ